MIYRAKVTAIEAQARRAWPHAKFRTDATDVYIEFDNAELAELIEFTNKTIEKSLKHA